VKVHYHRVDLESAVLLIQDTRARSDSIGTVLEPLEAYADAIHLLVQAEPRFVRPDIRRAALWPGPSQHPRSFRIRPCSPSRFGHAEVALRIDFRVWKGFDHFAVIEQIVIGRRSLEPEVIADDQRELQQARQQNDDAGKAGVELIPGA
jgi:hypothetical protein